jgi:hypothetical protein
MRLNEGTGLKNLGVLKFYLFLFGFRFVFSFYMFLAFCYELCFHHTLPRLANKMCYILPILFGWSQRPTKRGSVKEMP